MENTFNLREFFITILKKWKMIIVFAFVFAVLAGGYRGYSKYKLKQNMNTNDTDISDKLADKDIYQNELFIITKNIERIENEIVSTSEYRENSILYNLDPYNVAVSSLGVYIKGSSSASLIETYNNIIFSNELYTKISKESDIEKKYIQELITNHKKYENTSSSSGTIIIDSEENNRFFMINVYHHDLEISRKIIDLIEEYLREKSMSISRELGSHSIEIVNKNTNFEFVSSVLDSQKTHNLYYKNIKDSLVEYNGYLKDLKMPTSTTITTMDVLKNAVIFAVLGGVVGVALSVIMIFMLYLLSDSLMIEKYMKDKKLSFLGYLSSGKKISAFSNWVYKLEGYDFKNLSKENSLLIIKNNIQFFLDNKEITLISSNSIIDLKEMSKILSENNIKVDYIEDHINNPDLIKSINNSKNLVLIENIDSSSKTRLENIINYIDDYNFHISGYILTR